MGFWENVVKSMRARKGEFTGTSGNQADIENARYDPEDDSLNITQEWRTTHRYPGY